jgi:hypothetical protein
MVAEVEAARFDTHLLSMEEVWFVRDNPINIVCVRVKKAVREVEELERQLEEKRKQLDEAVGVLNRKMRTKNDR